MTIPSTKKIILSLGLSIVLGLAFYNTKDIMFGAPFSVKTAKDGETVTNDFLQINGYAKHASFVKINGRNITIDKNGNFSDGALLSPGYNIVEVKMADRFGKEKRKIYHLVANPPSSVATSLDKNYKLENN